MISYNWFFSFVSKCAVVMRFHEHAEKKCGGIKGHLQS